MKYCFYGGVGLSTTKPHENPLMPNEKLRKIYEAMATARAFDEWLLGRRRGKANRPKSTRSEEACRVSTTIDLGLGDLVSDSLLGPVMELLTGVAPRTLARSIAKGTSLPASGLRMPFIEDGEARLQLVLGAALALKMAKTQKIVVAYVYPHEVTKKTWQTVLTQASTLELPVAIVVLPSDTPAKAQAQRLPMKARGYGVPAITVDASDAVAIYRVMQESVGRVRQDGGPVLIECLMYHPATSLRSTPADPVAQMRKVLIDRKIVTENSLQRTSQSLQRVLNSAKAPRSR